MLRTWTATAATVTTMMSPVKMKLVFYSFPSWSVWFRIWVIGRDWFWACVSHFSLICKQIEWISSIWCEFVKKRKKNVKERLIMEVWLFWRDTVGSWFWFWLGINSYNHCHYMSMMVTKKSQQTIILFGKFPSHSHGKIRLKKKLSTNTFFDNLRI